MAYNILIDLGTVYAIKDSVWKKNEEKWIHSVKLKR